MPVPNLTAAQANQYEQQRSAARQNLLTQSATNVYNDELRSLSFKDNLEDFTVDWGRKRQALPQTYNERGLLQSGLYHQALQDYASDRLRGLNRLASGNQLAGQNADLQGRGYEDQYANAMYGSYNDEYATKADLAARLREIL